MADPHQSYITKNTWLMFASTVGGFFMNLVFNMYLSSTLGSEDYGDFKVAEALIDLGTLVALMGGATASLRFLPKYMREGKRAFVWEYVKLYGKIIFFISALMVIAMVIAKYFYVHLFGREYHPILLAAIVIPFAAFSSLLGGVLQTAKRLDLAFIPWSIGYPLIKLMGCVFLVFGTSMLTDIKAIVATFVAAFMIMAYELVQVIRLRLMEVAPVIPTPKPRIWLSVSLPLMFIAVLQVGLNQTNIYMLEIFDGESKVGYFAAASTTVGFFFIMKQAITNVIVPLITEAVDEGDDAVRRINASGFRLLAMISLGMTICMIIFADQILRLYGEDARAAKYAMMILLVGYVPSSIFGLAAVWLKYTGCEKYVVKVLAVAVLCNIIFNLILIPLYSIEGAAIATSMSMVLSVFLLTLKMHRSLGIFPWTGKHAR